MIIFFNKSASCKALNQLKLYFTKHLLLIVGVIIRKIHQCLLKIILGCTAWKVSKYGVFSGPYFPVFGLNTERYSVSLHIQPECGSIRTRKNSVFGQTFSVSHYPWNSIFTTFICRWFRVKIQLLATSFASDDIAFCLYNRGTLNILGRDFQIKAKRFFWIYKAM